LLIQLVAAFLINFPIFCFLTLHVSSNFLSCWFLICWLTHSRGSNEKFKGYDGGLPTLQI